MVFWGFLFVLFCFCFYFLFLGDLIVVLVWVFLVGGCVVCFGVYLCLFCCVFGLSFVYFVPFLLFCFWCVCVCVCVCVFIVFRNE